MRDDVLAYDETYRRNRRFTNKGAGFFFLLRTQRKVLKISLLLGRHSGNEFIDLRIAHFLLVRR